MLSRAAEGMLAAEAAASSRRPSSAARAAMACGLGRPSALSDLNRSPDMRRTRRLGAEAVLPFSFR